MHGLESQFDSCCGSEVSLDVCIVHLCILFARIIKSESEMTLVAKDPLLSGNASSSLCQKLGCGFKARAAEPEQRKSDPKSANQLVDIRHRQCSSCDSSSRCEPGLRRLGLYRLAPIPSHSGAVDMCVCFPSLFKRWRVALRRKLMDK